MFFFRETIPLPRFQGSVVTFQGIVLLFLVRDGSIIDVCCSGLSVASLEWSMSICCKILGRSLHSKSYLLAIYNQSISESMMSPVR